MSDALITAWSARARGYSAVIFPPARLIARRASRMFRWFCRFSDIDVGEQAEQRTAPVGSAPGMGDVQTFVARYGQALRKAVHQVSPDLLRLDHTRLGALLAPDKLKRLP